MTRNEQRADQEKAEQKKQSRAEKSRAEQCSAVQCSAVQCSAVQRGQNKSQNDWGGEGRTGQEQKKREKIRRWIYNAKLNRPK